MKVEDLLAYVQFVNRFTDVKRSVKLGKDDRMESNSEHSYQLALVGWYVADQLKLGLRKDLIFEYALVHDLVEVYAGDTDPFIHPAEFIASKEEREKQALIRIKQEFSDFPDLHESIDRYQAHGDKESRFLYLLDKILPIMNFYLAEETYHKRHGITYEKWKEHLEKKRVHIGFDEPHFQDLIDQVIGYFEERKGFFKE